MTTKRETLTLPSSDGFSVVFGGEEHVAGAGGNNPTVPVVRGPIAYMTTSSDYAPKNATTWGVRIDHRTGKPNPEMIHSGGLRVDAVGETGFAGGVRGASINATLKADADPGANATALRLHSIVEGAQAGPGNWWNIGLVVWAEGQAQLPSSQSGNQIGIEAHVAGYLEDDMQRGEGGRQAISARCHNLDLDGSVGPATFGAGVRVIHMTDPAKSGENWWEKAVHANGRDGVNGGILDGFVVEDVKGRSIHIVRAGEYGIDIDLTPSPYGVATANAIQITGGDCRSSAIRIMQEKSAPRVSFGAKHQIVGNRIATLDMIGNNSSGGQVTFAELFSTVEGFAVGAENAELVARVRRDGKMVPAVRIDAEVGILLPLKLPAYDVASLPSSSDGGLVYVRDGDDGSSCLAVHSGGEWRRVPLGAAVSATPPTS